MLGNFIYSTLEYPLHIINTAKKLLPGRELVAGRERKRVERVTKAR
jgi:hypothetical protein